MHNNIKESGNQLELGSIFCKTCGELIATLPTNGVKKFYSQCHKESCKSQ